MREMLLAAVAGAGCLWMAAVLFGLVAGPLKLTARQSGLGRVAGFSRGVAILSP